MLVEGNGWAMHLGDCVEVMRRLEAVDHVITDPPYEAEAHTKGRRIRGVTDRSGCRVLDLAPLSFEPISADVRASAGEQIALLVRRWAVVFCQAEATELWRDAMSLLRYRRTGVWLKPDGMPQLTGDRPGMGYESIVFMHAQGGRSRWNGGGRVGVFSHNKKDGGLGGIKNDHPTTKPIALMQELVELFADPGETILDPFAGSGTTGVACLRLGRKFIGIEKDEKYFRLCVERLSAEEQGLTLRDARAGQMSLLGGTK